MHVQSWYVSPISSSLLRRVVLVALVLAISVVVAAPAAQAAPPAQSGVTATVVSSSLNIRSGPGVGYKVVGSAPKGAQYAVTAQSGRCTWLQVASGRKAVGWIAGSPTFVKLSGACSSIPAAAASAAKPAAGSAAKGCAVLVNQLGFAVTINLKRADGWHDTVNVPAGAQKEYCVAPGSYTASFSSSAKPGALTFPVTVKGGEYYRIPLALP